MLRVFHVPDPGRSLVVAVAHLSWYCDTAVNTDRLVPKHHRAGPVTKGMRGNNKNIRLLAPGN